MNDFATKLGCLPKMARSRCEAAELCRARPGRRTGLRRLCEQAHETGGGQVGGEEAWVFESCGTG